MELEDFAKQVVALALEFPEAWQDSPWGDVAVKVRKKAILFGGWPTEDRFSISLKLPESGADVLEWEHAAPTGYGLGRHGWVSIGFPRGEAHDLEALRPLLEESFQAVAPKTLVKQWRASR